MHLTRHTDYALRMLIYLAQVDDRRASIAEVAENQQISRNHLMKIANELAQAGFLEATRGRGGGIALGKPASEISIAAVVRAMEPRCDLVDCTGCKLARRCSLPGMLSEAMAAFLDVLGGYTLADVVRVPVGLRVATAL